MRPSLHHLVAVHHEILAQAGQGNRRRGNLQIPQTALKVRLVGQYRERRSTSCSVPVSQPCNIKILSNQSLGRRSLLNLGNHRRSIASSLPQRLRPSARAMSGGQLFQFRHRNRLFRPLHMRARRGQNPSQMRRLRRSRPRLRRPRLRRPCRGSRAHGISIVSLPPERRSAPAQPSPRT